MASVGRNGKGEATLRIGIVGLGGGASDMIPAFIQHPHIELTAAADLDRGQLEKFRSEFHGETYLRAEELCENPHVDVVYIATPNQFHTEHALMALERGKHVLVEKPMTLTLDDADVMIQAAERHGMQLMVNVKHSFDPYIR
jgi:phthalate 4,5-cis-dihydrodiol dehydrogenase